MGRAVARHVKRGARKLYFNGCFSCQALRLDHHPEVGLAGCVIPIVSIAKYQEIHNLCAAHRNSACLWAHTNLNFMCFARPRLGIEAAAAKASLYVSICSRSWLAVPRFLMIG